MSSGRPRLERNSAVDGRAREDRTGVREIAPHEMRRLVSEWDDALLAALPPDVETLLLEVEIGELEPHDLGAPQAAGVRELEDRTVP